MMACQWLGTLGYNWYLKRDQYNKVAEFEVINEKIF